MQTLATWQALIAALLGAALAFAGVWWNTRSNLAQLKLRLDHEDKQLKLRLESEEKLHRQRLSKERLEELYGLVNDWSNGLFLNCHGLIALASKDITLEQYRDHINAPNMPRSDLGRLEMIAGIYGGTLQTVYNEAMYIKDKIGQVDLAIFDSLKKGRSCDDLLFPLRTFQKELAVTVDALKREIINAAKEV